MISNKIKGEKNNQIVIPNYEGEKYKFYYFFMEFNQFMQKSCSNVQYVHDDCTTSRSTLCMSRQARYGHIIS